MRSTAPHEVQPRALALFLFSMLIIATADHLWRSLSWSHTSWQLTEWLINYAGGFVRRGLTGEAFYHLSKATGVAANHLAIAFSLAIYLAFSIYFFNTAAQIYHPIVIASPLLIGAPAFQDFIVRKDVLILALFAISIKIATSTSISRSGLFKAFLLSVLSATAVLIHESFFFLTLPPVFLILKNLPNPHQKRLLHTFIVALVMGSLVGTFVAVTIFKGSSDVALAIHQSWLPLWREIDLIDCCNATPAGAIDAIGWSTSKGLSLSASLLTTFASGIYVPAVWLALIAISYWLMVQLANFSDTRSIKRLSITLLLMLLCVSPLFVLGWDFGRWIFLWLISSVILFTEEGWKCSYAPTSIVGLANMLVTRYWFSFNPPAWTILLYGAPVCCWSIYNQIHSSPLGFAAIHLLRAFKRILL